MDVVRGTQSRASLKLLVSVNGGYVFVLIHSLPHLCTYMYSQTLPRRLRAITTGSVPPSLLICSHGFNGVKGQVALLADTTLFSANSVLKYTPTLSIHSSTLCNHPLKNGFNSPSLAYAPCTHTHISQAVAMQCSLLRLGAPCGVTSTCLLSRMLQIKEELSSKGTYEPPKALVFSSTSLSKVDQH